MARNIHQRLSKFTKRLLSLLQVLHDKLEAKESVMEKYSLKRANPEFYRDFLEDISDGVCCYST